jgi:hypothetical protein
MHAQGLTARELIVHHQEVHKHHQEVHASAGVTFRTSPYQ